MSASELPEVSQRSRARAIVVVVTADMACNKITAGITRAFIGQRPIKAELDPYNPVGSTANIRFNTSKTDRWETNSDRCHINWVVLDSDWEADFCRVAESHPKVRAYVKNHNLGLKVPYRYGSEMRKYLPDFIVLVDDGHGEPRGANALFHASRHAEIDAVMDGTRGPLDKMLAANVLACHCGAMEIYAMAASREGTPARSIRCALWTRRSRIASAYVGSPMISCQRSTGS
jgi:hypothetical protein